MSELVAISFDANASPRIELSKTRRMRESAPSASPAIYGWGVGWYPASERGAAVLKDPGSGGDSQVGAALRDWDRFRSTLFVCHLRGHRRRRSEQDLQPFVRSYAGRHWIFAHDGDLDRGWAERFPLGDDPSFEPLGRSDSEHAFCWLLSRLHARRARSLSDVPAGELRQWLLELNAKGQLNITLSDGDLLVAYRDATAHDALYWTRLMPPHEIVDLRSDSVCIGLDAPEDPNRTLLVFSSTPLSSNGWQPLDPGQLMIARRGSVIWDSDPDQLGARAGAAQGTVVSANPVLHSEVAQQQAALEPSTQPTGSTGIPGAPRAERLLEVVQETVYRYEELVERSSHRILLKPIQDKFQFLESFELDLSPSGVCVEYDDVFGNNAFAVEISSPYTELRVASRARVRVCAPEAIEGRHRQDTIPLVWMPSQRQMLQAYLLPMELPETQLEELSHFAMSFVERNDSDLVGVLLDMNETIYRDFSYVTGSTTIASTPFDVFQSRQGVCQDFANLMICLARLLNVPARYRMGYLFTGADYENKIQSEASHAWLELYIPRVGWHGFDPTNGVQVRSDHIRVAAGRNYRDATPTTGTIYRGGGTETLSVSVQVSEVG